MELKPLFDRIVVKRNDAPTTTASGLTIPASAQGKSSDGQVIAVGPGRVLDNGQIHPMSVAVGDKVMFAKHAGLEVKVGEEDFLVLTEPEILGILKG